jgi:Rieske Fe-S protein
MAKLSRRAFLQFLNRAFVTTGLAALLGPVVAYFYPSKLEEMPTDPVLAGPVVELPVGKSMTIHFGRYPALIINTPAGLRAYSAVCTHFACIVKWDVELDQIVCPCHDGFFDVAGGQVLAGPPPEPLQTLPVAVVDGQIYVGGSS